MDEGRGEVVLEWQASGPLQYTVSPALALADRARVLDDVLSDERLDTLEEPTAILRDARHIGALSEDALDDWEVLREEFAAWAEDIAKMTTKHRHGQYEDRSQHRSRILRAAAGLYGSLVQLFDAVGFDVIRAVRIPRGLSADQLHDLAESVVHNSLIQSVYGNVHGVYRQLFESRDQKRDQKLDVRVDASDPYGDLLGSLVALGDDVDRFLGILEAKVEERTDVHDDAPELALSLPISMQETSLSVIREGVQRVLATKHLRVTTPFARLLGVFAGTVYDAVQGVHRGLQPEAESSSRAVRVDEARTALATLPEERLVPDEARTVQAALGVLFQADERLSQRELANRAGVSSRSLSRHRGRLEALGVLDVDEGGGWRAVVSFQAESFDSGGDGEAVVPEWASGGVRVASFADDVAEGVLRVRQYVRVSTKLGMADGPPDFEPLFAIRPKLRAWLRRVAGMTGTAMPGGGESSVVAVAGAAPRQMAVSG